MTRTPSASISPSRPGRARDDHDRRAPPPAARRSAGLKWDSDEPVLGDAAARPCGKAPRTAPRRAWSPPSPAASSRATCAPRVLLTSHAEPRARSFQMEALRLPSGSVNLAPNSRSRSRISASAATSRPRQCDTFQSDAALALLALPACRRPQVSFSRCRATSISLGGCIWIESGLPVSNRLLRLEKIAGQPARPGRRAGHPAHPIDAPLSS